MTGAETILVLRKGAEIAAARARALGIPPYLYGGVPEPACQLCYAMYEPWLSVAKSKGNGIA